MRRNWTNDDRGKRRKNMKKKKIKHVYTKQNKKQTESQYKKTREI